MLQKAYFLAKIGADTAENEQHFAEILPKIGNSSWESDAGHHPRRVFSQVAAGGAGAGKLAKVAKWQT